MFILVSSREHLLIADRLEAERRPNTALQPHRARCLRRDASEEL